MYHWEFFIEKCLPGIFLIKMYFHPFIVVVDSTRIRTPQIQVAILFQVFHANKFRGHIYINSTYTWVYTVSIEVLGAILCFVTLTWDKTRIWLVFFFLSILNLVFVYVRYWSEFSMNVFDYRHFSMCTPSWVWHELIMSVEFLNCYHLRICFG